MIAVSAAFSAAEIADIAQLAYQVFIQRGNYASTAAFGTTITSSGDDASGNYPVTGIGDGDRTEINMGAASVADNGVGLSSWKSSASPTHLSPVWAQLDFGTARTWNYIKLYNYSGDPLTSYALQYSDNGSVWTTFAGTADQGSGTGYTGATGGLDVFDFTSYTGGTSFTHRYLRVLVYGTTSTGPAQIVEIEVYNRVDVTNRATSVEVDRQRDWKQQNPMAATCTLVFDNSDRFFSPSHTPSSAETSSGFFNAELDEGLVVIVKTGFWYSQSPYYALGYGQGAFGGGPYGGQSGIVSGPEVVSSFVGTIDSIAASSLRGTATVTARDGMKDVINQTWSTRLKYNIDIGAAIQYLLNICNVSNYEMSVPTTGIIEPYFFVFEQSCFTAIQQLVQACGNAGFWFDENGIATFQDYLINAANSHSDFVWTSIQSSGFTVTNSSGSGAMTINGATVSLSTGAGGFVIASQSLTGSGAQWQIVSSAGGGTVVFAATQNGAGIGSNIPQGYFLFWGSSNTLSLGRSNGSGSTPTLASVSGSSYFSQSTWTAMIDASGHIRVWQNSTLVFSVTDTTYTSFPYFDLCCQNASGAISVTAVTSLNTALTPTVSGTTLTLQSSSIDQGTAVVSEGNFSAGFASVNAPITFQTSTSADGTTWSGWSTVTLNSFQQGSIPSAAARYIRYQISFTIGATAPLWSLYYVILSWSNSASVAGTRVIDDITACDVQETLAGDLGGDSSIVNYVEVLSAPLILTGTISDTQWQATAGFPAAKVSTSNPLIVNAGTVTMQAVISGGMDVSLMSGTNPAAVAITWGTATGSVAISYIHPTKPIITLTVTGAGTITDLRLIGQAFSNQQTPIDQTAGDAASQAKHKRRTNQISNDFITIPAIAQLIANTQLALYRNATLKLDNLEVPLAPSAQTSDALIVSDYNLDIPGTQNWKISGIKLSIVAPSNAGSGTAKTVFTALAS